MNDSGRTKAWATSAIDFWTHSEVRAEASLVAYIYKLTKPLHPRQLHSVESSLLQGIGRDVELRQAGERKRGGPDKRRSSREQKAEIELMGQQGLA